MRKCKKIIVIVFLIICVVLPTLNLNKIYATDILNNIKSWRQDGKSGQKNVDFTKFSDMAGFFWGIGLFVILICGVIIGIKLMFCNIEQKAMVKQKLIPYIIGTVIIFGALTIWTLVINILDNSII